MKKIKSLLFCISILISLAANATTWNEPWADEVIKDADYFVLANIVSFDEAKGVTINITKSLGGETLKGEIKITGFYLLHLCSYSDGDGPSFEFGKLKEAYFFIKKNDKGEYCIATPTTGFDPVIDENVYATYRHSYHQAQVPIDTYEKTMTAIFNNYHHLPYDEKFINGFVAKYLSMKPAGFEKSEADIFFAQHVALECVYHLKLKGYYEEILPFLHDTANFHAQMSAAQALEAYNTTECKQELLKVISDTSRNNFVQVLCIWTLGEFKPTELKQKLLKIEETASSQENGFGGNIMDPRVCTVVPDVKSAITELVQQL